MSLCLVQTSLLWLTGLCTNPTLLTCKRSSAFFDPLLALHPMACFCKNRLASCSMDTPTRLTTITHDDQPQISTSFSAPTLFLGIPKSRPPWHGLAQRLNTGLWPIVSQKSHGCNNILGRFVSSYLQYLQFTETIFQLLILH